jgi:hypothetical protein
MTPRDAPSPADLASVPRALSSLTATLGAIAERIERHQGEEHREPDRIVPEPVAPERPLTVPPVKGPTDSP